MYLTEQGWQKGKPPQGSVGQYVGRAGSMRRSRKGRTTRNANGSRKYLHGDGPQVVLAYRAGTSTGISPTQMANAEQMALLRRFGIIK